MKRWRQEDLVARLVGVETPQSVSHWETGTYAPTIDNVRQLDDVLEAGGAICAAYGVASAAATPSEQIEELRTEIAELRAQLDAILPALRRLLDQ
jgi:DNA-binding XRE family transcriptional regulator